VAGLVLLALLSAPILWQEMPVAGAMRLAWLDTYQSVFPRERRSAPAMIVAIDEASLDRFGQWPWPRTLIAQLIDRLRGADPAAIGIDILFAEPDRLSPDWVAPAATRRGPQFTASSGRALRNDSILAGSIRAAPVALGIAGLETGAPSHTATFTPSLQRGDDARASMRGYASALRSLPEIDTAARGHGVLSVETEGGIVRRVPMVALIGANPVLPLSLETLRVAIGEPLFVVQGSAAGVKSVGIGGLAVPTQPDGRLWVHFTPHDAHRFISAAGVLTGESDMRQFERKLVLVGVTGLGLVDYPDTPLGRMPGVEIHAQVLENVFDGDLLTRPSWVPWAEGMVFLLLGLVVIRAVPRISPARSVFMLVLLLGALGLLGAAAYLGSGILLDASVPGVGLGLVFAGMLAQTLSEANVQRKALRERLQLEREEAARLTGELDAARRIQIGILPRADAAFPGERRFEIYASMEPAREVGGDLYDFFMLDPDRLFFLVGDVSGKGLPASIFMAVSKALCKSAALRSIQQVGALLHEASTEIARENPESLFVTVFAGVLDANSGRMQYCCAGHEPPFIFSPNDEITRFEAGSGPPLCVIDGFSYTTAEIQMKPGSTLCLVTDGVTEGMNAEGELYGAKRLSQALQRARHTQSTAELVSAIRADLARFVAGAEPADDITLLVLRWNAR
jgi:adenylate cyclase